METKAKALGVGGKMRYVYPNGHNYGAHNKHLAGFNRVSFSFRLHVARGFKNLVQNCNSDWGCLIMHAWKVSQ